MAFVIAMVATAVVGAVIALPALRLRGLYLALATAAFSLAVEQMLFKEYTAARRIYPATLILLVGLGPGRGLPGLPVVPRARRVHRRGRVGAGRHAGGDQSVVAARALEPDLPERLPAGAAPASARHRLHAAGQLPAAARGGVRACSACSMIALRRSAYGRRLTAMKNSPAACATLGMNVVRLKLSVFMLSAAIAGLGGCLFAQEIGAVTSDRFSLFESMTMLMLLVVAGAGYVSGGLTAGLLYGAVFVALENVIAKIGNDYSRSCRAGARGSCSSPRCCPRSSGSGSGRNPSGFLGDVVPTEPGVDARHEVGRLRGRRRRARRLVPRVPAHDQQLDVRDPHRRLDRRSCPLVASIVNPSASGRDRRRRRSRRDAARAHRHRPCVHRGRPAGDRRGVGLDRLRASTGPESAPRHASTYREVRGKPRAVRVEHRCAHGRDHRPDRAERRGQDDAVQRHHRVADADGGSHPLRRPRRQPARHAQARSARDRAHVPAARAVHRSDASATTCGSRARSATRGAGFGAARTAASTSRARPSACSI